MGAHNKQGTQPRHRKLKGKTGNGHKQGKLQEPSNDHVEDEYDQ